MTATLYYEPDDRYQARRDDIRDRLEASDDFQQMAMEWWMELEPDKLVEFELAMLTTAIEMGGAIVDAARFARYFRGRCYAASADFATLVDDIADGAVEL